MTLSRILVWTLAAGMAGLGAGTAFAQVSYPSNFIRIVTSAAGSNNDWGARLIGDVISRRLGQRVLVENRGGLAAEFVAKAPPDGYTLLFYGPAAWTQQLFRNIDFDPQRDLAPITLAMSSPIVLVVHPSLPVKSVKELVAFAKAWPGQLNYSSGTLGATPYLAGELFKYMAGVNIVRVAYKGTGPSLIGIVSGEVEVMFPGAGSVWSFIQQGKLRALGVASKKPSLLTPGLQPIALTVPGYEAISNIAFMAPANTPRPIIDRLHQEIVRAMNLPEVQKILPMRGVEAEGGTPEELAEYIDMDIKRIKKMLQAVHIDTKKAY